jgi:FimV-like protein
VIGAARKPEPPLDRMIDEDITIAPGMKPESRESVFGGSPPKTPEPSVKDKIEASAASFKSSIGDVGGAASVAVAGAMAAGKSEIEALSGKGADKGQPAAAPGKYDLDFHLDEHEKPAPLRPVAESMTGPESGPTPSQLARPAAALELDKLDLSFDPDKATFEDPTPSVLDGQWHDAATKLDLAKAYQEMGDVEGAREILQEVLHEGDDQQKIEAQALLAKLG